jgi:hypothetical protein
LLPPPRTRPRMRSVPDGLYVLDRGLPRGVNTVLHRVVTRWDKMDGSAS